ncbi:MAG: hypothetical protein IKN54_06160 [Lachnospiraceae bacterium]|nr:hypothetical protein [Lachnospiraceae bacterium]
MTENVQSEWTVDNELVQFFDEMNIIKSEKKARVETARLMLKKMNAFYHGLYLDILDGEYLHGKAEGDYIDDLIAVYIGVVEKTDKSIMYDTDIINKSHSFANQIMRTTRNQLSFEDDPELQSMISAGVPISEKRLPQYTKDSFAPDGWRAVEAAKNESLYIHNYKRHKEKKATQTTHTWVSMRDEFVRPAHAAADGQTVPINEPFIVGGYPLYYPGDVSANPPAELVICCRCVEA